MLYVANKNMSPKEAEAFSKLLTDMIRSMESLSWSEGVLRNAALDHLAVPRYGECKPERSDPLGRHRLPNLFNRSAWKGNSPKFSHHEGAYRLEPRGFGLQPRVGGP